MCSSFAIGLQSCCNINFPLDLEHIVQRKFFGNVLTFLGFSVLGGHAVNLSPDDAHLGVSESIKDTSKLVFFFLLTVSECKSSSDFNVFNASCTVPLILRRSVANCLYPRAILSWNKRNVLYRVYQTKATD